MGMPGASSGKQAQGQFLGWQKGVKACQEAGQILPQRSRSGTFVYSGYCDSDIRVDEPQCGGLRSASLSAAMDALDAISKKGATSVILKHLDVLKLHAPMGDLPRSYHPALRPAKLLRELGDKFIAKTLGG